MCDCDKKAKAKKSPKGAKPAKSPKAPGGAKPIAPRKGGAGGAKGKMPGMGML